MPSFWTDFTKLGNYYVTWLNSSDMIFLLRTHFWPSFQSIFISVSYKFWKYESFPRRLNRHRNHLDRLQITYPRIPLCRPVLVLLSSETWPFRAGLQKIYDPQDQVELHNLLYHRCRAHRILCSWCEVRAHFTLGVKTQKLLISNISNVTFAPFTNVWKPSCSYPYGVQPSSLTSYLKIACTDTVR